MARIRMWSVVLGACVYLLAGCGRGERPEGPLRVVVSIPPLAGLAEEVALSIDPEAEVVTLVPAGRSPHGFELTPEDARAIAGADVTITIGLGLESGLDRALARSSARLIEFATLVGIEAHADHSHDHEGHDHGDHDHGHHHGPVDPHLWLDPGLVERLIPALSQEIATSATEIGISTNAGADGSSEALVSRVRALDDSIRDRLRPFAGAKIVTHHDALSRYAERYGLEIAAVIRPIESAEPTPSQIAGALEAIRAEGATAIFLEPQFSASAAQRIARQGGLRIGRLDPLGRGDWFEMMDSLTNEIVRVLGEDETGDGG